MILGFPPDSFVAAYPRSSIQALGRRLFIMTSCKFKTHSDLIDFLREINVQHSLVPTGNEKKQAEKALAYKTLATFSQTSPFMFPLEVIQDEKPDFQFHMENLQIGAECTMAMSELFGRVYSLREKQYPNSMIDLSYVHWGAPNLTNDQIFELLKQWETKLTGPPLFGNSIEKYWSATMMDCISAKTERLNALDYGRRQLNWLLINDNVHPHTDLSLKKGLSILSNALNSYFLDSAEQIKRFDSVFIKTNDQFIVISRSGISSNTINNLWQQGNQ